MTNDGSKNYSFDADNRLTAQPSGSVTLAYDPTSRLSSVAQGGTTTRFLYDGADLIAEYNGTGTLLRRYVHGPGVDDPLVWLEGTGTSDRRWLAADERGSVLAATNVSGALVGTLNRYDTYGIPAAANTGRFQYTGQLWIPELALYHYKARVYHPRFGRFLQTDPIRYGDGMNLYAYVGNDPINATDPTGLLCAGEGGGIICDTEAEVIDHIQNNLPEDSNRREYGGYILSQPIDNSPRDADLAGTDGNVFSYTQSEGEAQTVDLGDPPADAVAAWHSHPSEIQNADGSWEDVSSAASYFSLSLVATPSGPGRTYSFETGDIAWAYRKDTPLYLLAPSGEIKRASPDDISLTSRSRPDFGGLEFVLRYNGVR